MDLHLITSRFELAAAANATAPLQVAGVYADLPAYLLATRLLHEVSAECSTVCKLNAIWRSFDVLAAESGRAADAVLPFGADMVWCSSYACHALPEPVKACMAAWSSQQRESERALVALLQCPPGYELEQSPARAWLTQLAEAAGLELFVQRFDCGCHNPADLRTPQSALLSTHKAPFEDIPRCQQFRHWGLNE